MENIKLIIPDVVHNIRKHKRKATKTKYVGEKIDNDNEDNDNDDEEGDDEEEDDNDDGEEENMKLIMVYNGKTRIKTRKDQLILKLRYFRKNTNEMNRIINSKIISIEDKYSPECFTKFIRTLKRKEIIINEKNCYELYELSEKYGHEEMYKEIKRFIEERPDIKRMIKNLINQQDQQFLQKNKNSENNNNENNDDDDDDNDEILKDEDNSMKEEIIAKNLDLSLQSGLLSSLRISTLNRIFNSPHRQLNDHHLLFEFILKMMNSHQNERDKKDNEYTIEEIQILISSLDYLKMTKKEIKELIENENFQRKIQPENVEKRLKGLIEKKEQMKIDLMKMNEELNEMKEMRKKMEQMMNETNKKLEEMKEEMKDAEGQNEIKFQNLKQLIDEIDENKLIFRKSFFSDKFDGIFRELNRRYNGNVIDKGIVEVTGNNSSHCSFSTLIDFGNMNKSFYLSTKEENSSLCFNFKDHNITLSSYSIKSSICTSQDPDHLKSWTVKGWNEKEGWIELDSHSNDCILYEGQRQGKEVLFEIGEERKKSIKFQKIQLQMTGASSENRHYLEIAKIEFFGIYYLK